MVLESTSGPRPGAVEDRHSGRGSKPGTPGPASCPAAGMLGQCLPLFEGLSSFIAEEAGWDASPLSLSFYSLTTNHFGICLGCPCHPALLPAMPATSSSIPPCKCATHFTSFPSPGVSKVSPSQPKTTRVHTALTLLVPKTFILTRHCTLTCSLVFPRFPH